MDTTEKNRADFAGRQLPWIIAAVAAIVYLATLNHWVTIASLPVVAKVTGWDWWSLDLQGPLFHIATLPIRLAPSSWQPILLNIFSALCAAGALGLLARSVQLLPHDRTHEQRQRERSEYSLLSIPLAWIPPVFAVLAVGFQLTFWEHSTAATGETFNALLFIYIVRCLLEYRIDQKDSWYYQAVLVYGLSVTNNWAMIGFMPVLLVGMIWIMGLHFFRVGFILKMAGIGVVSLLPYLILPTIAIYVDHSQYGFWPLLKTELLYQKEYLSIFWYSRLVILFCCLTSLLPVMVIGFRWPTSFGDISALGIFLTNLMFRVIHVLMLVVCIWVLFDPPFSPRVLGYGFPFLLHYLLSALAIGYFSGYFLLVFGSISSSSRRHRSSSSDNQVVNSAIVGLVCLAFVAVPAGLIFKNWHQIKENNGSPLRNYANRMMESLPTEGALVLSDEPMNLLLLEAVLSSKPQHPGHVLIDTRSLRMQSYHKSLTARYPKKWPSLNNASQLSDPIPNLSVLQLLLGLSQKQPLFYLHPSYGYFMEGLRPDPKGVVYQLTSYKPGVVLNETPSASRVQAEMAFWKQVIQETSSLSRSKKTSERDRSLSDNEFVLRAYSRSVNYLGVLLQRGGLFKEAAECFEDARALNSNNLVASVNLSYNQALQKGQKRPIELDPDMESKIKGQNWGERLIEQGPFDEPRFCAELGENFATAKPPYIRMAAQEFMRVKELNPANLEVQIWLGNLFLKWPLPQMTLEVIETIRKHQTETPLNLAYQIELVNMEAWAYVGQTNYDKAIQLLVDEEQKNPSVASLPETLSQIYAKDKQFEKALVPLERQLRLDPNNTVVLMNKSALLILTKQYALAIPPLTRIIETEPKNVGARMNRAIAALRCEQWDMAKGDSEIMLKLMPESERYVALFNLGFVADHQKETAKAIDYFDQYLKSVPRGADKQPRTPELVSKVKEVEKRLQELRGSGR